MLKSVVLALVDFFFFYKERLYVKCMQFLSNNQESFNYIRLMFKLCEEFWKYCKVENLEFVFSTIVKNCEYHLDDLI